MLPLLLLRRLPLLLLPLVLLPPLPHVWPYLLLLLPLLSLLLLPLLPHLLRELLRMLLLLVLPHLLLLRLRLLLLQGWLLRGWLQLQWLPVVGGEWGPCVAQGALLTLLLLRGRWRARRRPAAITQPRRQHWGLGGLLRGPPAPLDVARGLHSQSCLLHEHCDFFA